ncbi:MAG: sigma 54-interacting transcriptional regulator, partial [Erythrobacter sp.]
MPTSRPVLLVEDDAAIATVIIAALEDEGFTIVHCTGIAARDRQLAARGFGVMLTDVILEDGDGLASLSDVRERAPDMPVIVLSAQNTLDTAVRASESDAFEYFPKPFDLDELVQAVRQAAGMRAPSPEDPGGALPGEGERMPLVGRSPAMQGVYRMITRVLRNDLAVLITGESGTGKELVAEAIHELGNRRTGPFVAVNTAAIPADLVESELFGHEKGAFTGAIAQAIGKFEQANGGTLFLDEIGDWPADVQTRMVRLLQDIDMRLPSAPGKNPVRIIASTHRDLRKLIEQGAFRDDLFFRLNVVPVRMPPLRERPEDVAELVQHFFL